MRLGVDVTGRQVPTLGGGSLATPKQRKTKLGAQRRLEQIRVAGDAMTAAELELSKRRQALNTLISDTYHDDLATPTQIGNVLGISRQRVYQIIQEIVRKGV